MSTKAGSVESSGESGLFLPELIDRGLGARDRLQYYVSLLQAAETYALAPHHPAPTLRAQREASGISDEVLDQIVAASQTVTKGLIRIPGAGVILERIFGDLRQMLQPLRAAAASRPEMRERLDVYQHRLDQQIADAPPCHDDQLTSSAIDGLAVRTQNGHDSVHQLVMDLQWELGRLSSVAAPESIDGARGYGVTAEDRTLVQAFMRGLNQTRGLQFDRAGLVTSATRDDDRLSIQSDLGVHEVQTVVVHVSELAATVIITDANRARVQFFREMLLAYDIRWEAPAVAASEHCEATVGVYNAENQASLESFLAFVGSRLVFLVDWERARRRLARVVKNSEAIAVLKWAADHNVGHHAFLQAGDVRLIYAALEGAVPAQIRFGTRLDELLGRDATVQFLTSVLTSASAGFSAGRSMRQIEDEIEAELLMHLRTAVRGLLATAAEHATVVSTIAEHLSQGLARLNRGEGRDQAGHALDLANGLEARAGEILRRPSRLLEETREGEHLRRLLAEGDVVADAIEDAAFMLTLVPVSIDPKSLQLLGELADLVSRAAREYIRCLLDARDLSHLPARHEIEQFLIAFDQLVGLRQQASTTERAIRERLVGGTADYRELYVSTAMARCLDKAVHVLVRCSVVVRDYVLTATSGMAAVA